MSGFMKTSKKIMAVILCVLMLLPFMFTDAFAAKLLDEDLLYEGGHVTAEKYYTVAKGITEKYIVLSDEDNSNQIKNYIYEVDLSNPNLSIVVGYNDGDGDGWGLATLPAQVDAIEQTRGVTVVAAVNGGGFNTTTGELGDICIMNGVMVQQPNNNKKSSFFAILNDGTAAIRKYGESTDDVREAVPAMQHLIENGKVLSLDGVTKHPRTSVGIKKDGTVVFMVSDGRQSPDSCGMTYVEQANTMKALGCVDAVALDGGGSSTFMTRRESLSSFTVRNNPCYGFVRPIGTSVMVCSTATATGVFDHISFAESEFYVYPSRSIEINAVGCDVNGFKTDLPNGKLVLDNTDCGTLIGSTFFANLTEGTVNACYVSNGEVIARVPIVVTYDAESRIDDTANTMIRLFGNLRDMIQFVFEKLLSYLQ